jgi:16S rRNA (adenine1518-N6/adenine1519-N6)-dimethyltransferase
MHAPLIKPNKFLGQVFLRSKKVVRDIIEAADIKDTDVILEVGPGTGVLTEELIKCADRVIAVEKDKKLFDLLAHKFSHSKNLLLLNQDILKFNPRLDIPVAGGYKIVANIPYYLTSKFLRNFLEGERQPRLMVLLVQKEVGERILARDNKESLLSISIKVYGRPKIIKQVPAGNFYPKPGVDSVILRIDNISKKFFRGIKEAGFFAFVRQGFSHKRKMLKSNLKIRDERIFKKCGLGPKIRAEDLSPAMWKCLYKNIDKLV